MGRMRTLAAPGILDQTLARIASLHPDDAARWGRMIASQMLCHLSDSAKLALGEITVPPGKTPLPPRLFKWLALDVPLRWAKNFPTMPQVDQLKDGTPPVVFTHDQQTLIELTTRLTQANLEGHKHPYFGPMSLKDWMRWAWLHTDHHLRQFGR